MHKCEPTPPPPPVPPRRRRRVVNNLETSKKVEDTNRIKKVDRKRLPPPPPPSQLPRKNKARLVQGNQIQTRITVHVSSSKDQKDECNEIVRSADSKNTNLGSLGLGDVNKKQEELTVNEKDNELFVHSSGYDRTVREKDSADSSKINSDNLRLRDTDEKQEELRVDEHNDELFVHSPRYDRIVRKEEFNKYPSLFFTLDDIQNVILDTFPNDEKVEDPKMEENKEVENSLAEDNVELVQETEVSFIDNCMEDENDVCFRVTPTNFPFEKCLERWKTSLDCDNFGIDEKNNFIFEDYMDRSNALNVRRSRAPMCYDVFDSDEMTMEHTATKVRFVIESPSSSTPDIDIQDSLQNVDSITNEEADEHENHIENNSTYDDPVSGDVDMFDEIPFGSVIESNVSLESHETCFNSPVKGVENKEEEARVNFLDNSDPSSVEDRFPQEQVPSNSEVERSSQAQELSPEHEVSKTVDRVNENLVFPEDPNESSNSQKQFNTRERRKIFVTQSLRSFIDDSPVDWEDNESQNSELVEEDYSDKLEISEEKFSDLTITKEELASESGMNVSRSEESIEKVDILTGKEPEVPVSVRRNSFLERMLSDDCSDKTWDLGYCEIVAAHPKNDQLTLIEETNEKNSNIDPIDTKNVVDVKTNVLNELLSNFATIKLKNVSKPDENLANLKNDETIDETTENINDKDANRITMNEMAVLRIQAEINVSEKLNEDMKNSKTLQTDSKGTKHSDDQVEVAFSIIDETKNTNLDDLVTTSEKNWNDSLEHEERSGSATKCAIVREKTPNVLTHRNNDDNNRAVRIPVALSNDQSSGQEPPTIIPGSVRSFIKYYEIRRETTAVEDSKINDRRTVDQKSNLVRSNVGQDSVSSKIRRFEYKEEIKAARENIKTQLTSKNDKKEITINPESVSNEISYTMIVKKVIEPRELKMRCIKSSQESQNGYDSCYSDSVGEGSIKNDRKKSVQFSGGHTVIRSHEVDLENAEADLEDGFSQPDQHVIQEVPRAEYERNSGINRFVSNTTSNARLVFYCTV
ncbi:hypothetical protein KPH14_012081 [Odynerus spinipes]|uniref:Uncharacterized protein n=1 Tax=Odynerus spinipes TaxID=1348599 RepID=A0AAD9VJ71_9HYME|nr:hypothetical protein KPH14_012081 [Odynerus spinipes]